MTPAESHLEKIDRYWHRTPLCDACDDKMETHTLDHCDERSHGKIGYLDCEECPKCSHCGMRFAERPECEWLFFLPEQDIASTVGWCSESCLSADCDSRPKPLQFAQDLTDEWWLCHVSYHGLGLTIAEWAKVRTDREWRTFIALRAEVARQQSKAHKSPEPVTTISTTYDLFDTILDLLEHGDIPLEWQKKAREAMQLARREMRK